MRTKLLAASGLIVAAVALCAAPAQAAPVSAGNGPSVCSQFAPGWVFVAPTARAHENNGYNNPRNHGDPFIANFLGCNPHSGLSF